jgi:hypothetical protein
MKGVKINMDLVNCVLLVIILILVIVCCFKRERFSAPGGNAQGFTKLTTGQAGSGAVPGNEVLGPNFGNQPGTFGSNVPFGPTPN